jgi:hypothetical protein
MNTTTTSPAFRMDCHGGCGYGVSYPEAPTADERRELNAAFESHLGRCAAEAERRESMRLIHDYAGPGGVKRDALKASDREAIDQAVWDLQDGYGIAGFTPAQGWDWSGIRDSSASTVRAMAYAIRRIVGIAA